MVKAPKEGSNAVEGHGRTMKNKLFLVFIVVAFSTTMAIGQERKPYSEADGEVYDGRIGQVKGGFLF